MKKLAFFLACCGTYILTSGQTCNEQNSCRSVAGKCATELSASEQTDGELEGIQRLAAAVEQAQTKPQLTKELLMSKEWKFGSGDTITFTDSSVTIHDVSGHRVAMFFDYEIDGDLVRATRGIKQERQKYSWDEEDKIPGSMTFAWDGEKFL